MRQGSVRRGLHPQDVALVFRVDDQLLGVLLDLAGHEDSLADVDLGSPDMPQLPVGDPVPVHLPQPLQQPGGIARVPLLLNRHVQAQQSHVVRQDRAGSPHQGLERMHVVGRSPQRVEDPVVVAEATQPIEFAGRVEPDALRLQRAVVDGPVCHGGCDHVDVGVDPELLDEPPAVRRHPRPLRRPGGEHRNPLPLT
jgi:hypothetical protein